MQYAVCGHKPAAMTAKIAQRSLSSGATGAKPDLRKQRIEQPEFRVEEPGEDQADHDLADHEGHRNNARIGRIPATV